ncbi:transposon Tf2-11 polyprotein [Elysia marginata]|uniref:Transposon Tf2-11 polyprotein n=1 Tax=Elysia marginata TaxID=1093978 RepID=A0AAV4JVR9_9GAST|nr:transposon Tf2-11 polyprotein [Elysia marginata]
MGSCNEYFVAYIKDESPKDLVALKSLANAYTDARPSKTFAKKQNVSFVATDSSSHTSYRPSVHSNSRAPRGSHSFNFSRGRGRGFYKSQDYSHLSSSHRSPSAGRFQHKSASTHGSTGSDSVDSVPVKEKNDIECFQYGGRGHIRRQCPTKPTANVSCAFPCDSSNLCAAAVEFDRTGKLNIQSCRVFGKDATLLRDSRAKFDQRTRQPNESISSFIAALRHLSEHCEFGSTLNDRLCEKFVTGVNHVEIQRKLILETNLTLDKAIQIAKFQLQSSEAARALAPPAVNALHDRASKPPRNQRQNQKTGNHHHPSTRLGKLCHRYNGPHSAQQCKFKKATCYHCNKMGYIAKACLS